MGKKHKKSYYSDFYRGGKDSKKSKKNKKAKKLYDEPKLKTVSPSLSKKEAKENRKIVLRPVDVDKEFIKNRRKCNHAGKLISVAEYKSMTPNWAAYTPMLDAIVKHYGEDNVMICKACFDVIVDTNLITADDIAEAQAVLYAANNAVVSHTRMKSDEIKSFAKQREDLDSWSETKAKYADFEEKLASVGEVKTKDLSALNKLDGSNGVIAGIGGNAPTNLA